MRGKDHAVKSPVKSAVDELVKNVLIDETDYLLDEYTLKKDKYVLDTFGNDTHTSPEIDTLPMYHSKRYLVDMPVAGTLMILAAPVVLATAVAIGIEGFFNKKARGPLFFEKKSTLDGGKRGKILKFRSMYKDAEQDVPSVYDSRIKMICKEKNDPRSTNVGMFIRKYGIDELPQLWDIFTGKISTVGPRVYSTELFEELSEMDRTNRYRIKQGLTGEEQIGRKYDFDRYDFNSNLDLDDSYVNFYENEYNIFKDYGIILKTALHVVSGKHR